MSVASKNLFAYLGNDDDGEEKPVVPVKTVDKNQPRTTKRNEQPQAPVRGAGAGGNRRGGPGGNEGAFRDRGAGSERNQGRSTDEVARGDRRGGGAGARVRGGRGARRPRDSDDRLSRTGGQGGSDKQAAQSWGATEGEAELKDEQAGEAIAQAEQKDALAEDAAGEEPAEPEDKSVSYADYLAQQAEKKLALDSHKIRGANEGSKLDKKWQGATAIEKDDQEEFITGTYGKKQRERERKTKQTIDFDPRILEPERPRGGARGGRGGPRGGRGGERGGRGGERGSRGGNFRGGRGGAPRDGGAASINTKDESAFPTLGK